MKDEKKLQLMSSATSGGIEDSSARKTILIIEDDSVIRNLLRVSIESDAIRVIEADRGETGLVELAKCQPDLLILDLGLPDISGNEVLRRLREWSDIPVLILSAQEDTDEKIEALDSGAQDYVTKPFATGELLARIRVALRATSKKTEPVFDYGNLRVNFSDRIVTVDDKLLHFTPIEYSILRILAKNMGRVVPKPYIKKIIWGDVITSTDDQLRVHMASLRKKLKDRGVPYIIKTENGVGYRI